jgi:hypothetical protein
MGGRHLARGLGLKLGALALLITGCSDGAANPNDGGGGGDAAPPADGGIDASAMRNCAPHPSQCGYPDDTNTGVPTSVTLTPSPSLNITTDGAVVTGLDVAGGIEVSANNVTIKNVRVTGGGEAWGLVVIHQGITNTLIEDSVLRGTDNSTGGIQSAITDQGGNSTTIRRTNFYYCSQCISSGTAVVEDSYFHDQAQWIDPQWGVTHNEAFYDGCGESGLTVRHNTIFNEFDQTATVFLKGDFGTCTNITVDDNLLVGGGYTVYGGMASTTDFATTNVVFTGNRFSALLFPNGGFFGPVAYFDDKGAGNVWSGNFWDETGDPVQ